MTTVAVMGASFQIGRSALAAYQAAIAAAGQNIANVGNPDYARQTARLAAMHGGLTPAGVSPGTGVEVSALRRHVDEALEARLRWTLSQQRGAATRYEQLSQVESLYNELSGQDLSTRLTELFGRFASLQTNPADGAARDTVLGAAQTLVRELQRQRSGVRAQIDSLNAEVQTHVEQANAIVGQIASLNGQIVAAAARGSGGDSGLRDRRDGLLRSLAELVDITTRPQDNGVVNVYVGSEPIVEYSRSRGLAVQRSIRDGVERTDVRFADNGGRVPLTDGRLAALVQVRDGDLVSQLGKLDQLARALIYEVNRAHSSGCGLVGYTAITGTYAASDRDAALNSPAAGLAFPVQNGTFRVVLRDANGVQTTTRLIEVDLDGLGADTSLSTLAQSLNAIEGLTAGVTVDGRLQVRADAGLELTFHDDSSGALAALGVGTFFDGVDAATIEVNPVVLADRRLIATSRSGAPGDGSNAGLLANAGSTASALLGGHGVQDFHDAVNHALAVQIAALQDQADAADAIHASLYAQREAVSGVSLDEEAVNLTMFERAFQGASRYLSVVQNLSQELLTIAG